MNKSLLLLYVLMMSTLIADVHAQDGSGIPLNGWVLNDQREHCRNSDAAITVKYVNLFTGETDFSESFATMTNERGQFSLDLGTGAPNGGVFDLVYLNNLKYKLELDIVVDCDGQQITIEDQSATTPRVPVADNWGPAPAPRTDSMKGPTWKEIMTGPYHWTIPIFQQEGDGNISDTYLSDPYIFQVPLKMDDLCGFEIFGPYDYDLILEVASNHQGDPIIVNDYYGGAYLITESYAAPVLADSGYFKIFYEERVTRDELTETFEYLTYSIAMPQGKDKEQPVVFTNRRDIETVESMHTLHFPSLHGLSHGLEVTVDESPSTEMNSAAIFANNPLGTTGIFAVGGSWGSFSQGQNGAFGVTLNETVSGAGNWGTIGFTPADGNFAYGVLADGNGLTSATQSWAAAIIGDGFHTGEFVQLSDRRLKRAIRTPDNSLQMVRSLQPRIYEYEQGTSLGLSEGLHHGFIAQEVEEVIPELVTTVVLPESRDSENGEFIGTQEFQAVNYTELIPILTGAVQELSDKVDRQEAEIAELKALIEELQND